MYFFTWLFQYIVWMDDSKWRRRQWSYVWRYALREHAHIILPTLAGRQTDCLPGLKLSSQESTNAFQWKLILSALVALCCQWKCAAFKTIGALPLSSQEVKRQSAKESEWVGVWETRWQGRCIFSQGDIISWALFHQPGTLLAVCPGRHYWQECKRQLKVFEATTQAKGKLLELQLTRGLAGN